MATLFLIRRDPDEGLRPTLYVAGVWTYEGRAYPQAAYYMRDAARRQYPRSSYDLERSLPAGCDCGPALAASLAPSDTLSPAHRAIVEAFVAGDPNYLTADLNALDALFNITVDPAPAPAPAPAGSEEPQFRFEVRRGPKGGSRDEWSVVSTHDDVEEAKAALAALKAAGIPEDQGIALKKIDLAEALDPNWEERELQRFITGRYKRVPWDTNTHDQDYLARRPLRAAPEGCAEWYRSHYVHIAEGDASKVAFTESAEKGQRDVQKVLTVEAYFKRFYSGETYSPDYGGRPRLDEPTWRAWEEEMTGAAVPVQFAPLGDPDAMEAAYRRSHVDGAASCMTQPVSSYATGGIHPVRVYALGGDLTLAYLTEGEGEEAPIIARALVWPERKKVGRVYGNQPHANRLVRGLVALGYDNPRGSYEELDGARFARIVTRKSEEAWRNGEASGEYGDMFIVPYIDGEQLFTAETGDDKFFRIASSGECYGNRTDGLAFLRRIVECAHCDSGIDDGESYSFDDNEYCYSCISEISFVCADCNERHDIDDTNEAYVPYYDFSERVRSVTVCGDCLSDNYTLVDGDTYYQNGMVSDCEACLDPCLTETVRDLDGLSRCNSCFSEREELREARHPVLNALSDALSSRYPAPVPGLVLSVTLPAEADDPEEHLRLLLAEVQAAIELARTAQAETTLAEAA